MLMREILNLMETAGEAPLVAYHGTSHVIHEFRPWTHFGTLVAARQRLRDSGKAGHIYRVELIIRHPLRVTDMDASDEAAMLNAIKAGRYPQLDLGTANRLGVAQALLDAGFDGLTYVNRFEHRGRLSYVILSPDQARITGRDPA